MTRRGSRTETDGVFSCTRSDQTKHADWIGDVECVLPSGVIWLHAPRVQP